MTAGYAGATGIAKGLYGRKIDWLAFEQPNVYPAVRRYLVALEDAIAKGLGLFLYGGRGTGKTTTMALIAEACRRTYLLREHRHRYYQDSTGRELWRTTLNPWPIDCRYERMSSLAPYLSDFTHGKEEAEKKDARVEQLRGAQVLLIDELGIGEFRNNGEAVFFEIIEGRIEERRPTCFAANGTMEQLLETASNVMLRLLDKLKPVSIPLGYAGESRRKTWGSSKQLTEEPEDEPDNRSWDQKIGD